MKNSIGVTVTGSAIINSLYMPNASARSLYDLPPIDIPSPHLNKLKVKPIMTIEEGRAIPIGRTRTRPKAMDRLIELTAENIKGSGPLHAAVLHGDVLEEAEKLKKLLSERFTCTEIVTSEITPVIGTHTGPGTLGIATYEE